MKVHVGTRRVLESGSVILTPGISTFRVEFGVLTLAFSLLEGIQQMTALCLRWWEICSAILFVDANTL
jgi:hypothetical protein